MADARKTGPGCTRWEAQDNGSITCIKWNNPSWQTTFLSEWEMRSIDLPGALQRAYEMGRKDQAKLFRNAINYGARP